VPGGLVVLAVAIAVSSLCHLDRHGVAVVGRVPAGLPSVHGLGLHIADLWVLLPSAAGMMLVIFSEALGAADTFAEKHGYQLEPSQEMVALGLANIGSGLLGGLAAGGSLSQSAVNDGAGARSELAPVVAAVLSLITVVALTPLFTSLPEAVLAAMIIHAVWHLMKVAEMRRFYRLVRREFWLGMITLVGVITLDVLPGLVIGVVLSLLVLAYWASRPPFSVMGAVRGVPGAYEDVNRHRGARPVPGVLVIRPDAPLFYANAKPLRDTVRVLARSSGPVRAVVLDLDATDQLDVTAAEALAAVAAGLQARGIRLGLAHLHAAAASVLGQVDGDRGDAGWEAFPTLDSAVRWAAGDAAPDALPAPRQAPRAAPRGAPGG
jgi:MFS superfamily sulfate permease-like transporter